MTRLFVLALLAAAASVPATAGVMVATATGDWSKLPQLNQRGYNHLNEKMQAKLFEIAESGKCPSFVLNQGRLNFSVTFATQYSSDGTLQRLILPQLNCAEAESVVGGALLEMLQAGDYAPTGKSGAGWYKGGLEFSFAGAAARDPAVAQPVHRGAASTTLAADQNQIVCEKVTELGSRLSTKRVCMSRAEWAERRRQDRITTEAAQQTRCQEADHSC
jgi:hypothetical protein